MDHQRDLGAIARTIIDSNFYMTLGDTGVRLLAYFVTQTSVNNCPSLPVREERIFVLFSLLREQSL